MKTSYDGGQTWQTDMSMTSAVTAAGQYMFDSGPDFGLQAHAISFAPTDRRRILIGTETAVIESRDGGSTWNRLSAINPNLVIPTVTSFFFDERTNLVWVSTYGRGLWALS